jgi:hypothetical protein
MMTASSNNVNRETLNAGREADCDSTLELAEKAAANMVRNR